MSPFVVRVSKPEDAEGVDGLLEASYPRLLASAYDEAELAPALGFMTKVNPKLLACGTYYVAEAPDGLIVGCGGWTLNHPNRDIKAGLAHIRHFGTHPAWTRRGVGRALYGRCEHDARRAGLDTFECCSSLNAEVFYASLGFERIGRIEIEMGPGVVLPSVLMRRRFA